MSVARAASPETREETRTSSLLGCDETLAVITVLVLGHVVLRGSR